MTREFEDYENEIEDLHNRLDIAEYDKERLREEVTNLEAKIKALSQEPTDAISRKDIQDYIAKYLSQYLYEDVRQAVEAIDTYIGDMPSVTQKSGKWLRAPLLTCDRCHKINKSGEETDYCPNCGARMESEE